MNKNCKLLYKAAMVNLWSTISLFIFTVNLGIGDLKQEGITDWIDISVKRFSRNQGFHRDVVTEVLIPLREPHLESSCLVLLLETFPTGLYVDQHQVDSQHLFGAPQVYSEAVVDIEKPEFLSSAYELQVFSNMTLQDGGAKLRAGVVLPVHLRYHRPSSGRQGNYATVTLPHPHLYTRCTDNTDLPSFAGSVITAACAGKSSQVCEWKQMKYTINAEPLEFSVPVGDVSHYNLVVVVTLLATSGATVAVLYFMWTIKPVSKVHSHSQ